MATRLNVSFPSNGLKLIGHLYIPEQKQGAATSSEHRRLPAIVVGHPFSGVKEQVAGLYARLLAEQGFITLAFDAAYYGESEGEPRGLENPFQRIEDIKAAVTYLSTREDVDAKRIGGLGICAGGGYVACATQSDLRIRAIATVSAVETSSFLRDGLGRTTDPAVWKGMLEQAALCRTQEALGKPVVYLNALPDTVDASTPAFVKETFDYYRTPRGQHARSDAKVVMHSVDKLAHFDAFGKIDTISPRPILMIAGSKAATFYFSREAIDKAKEPKQLFVFDGASHFDLYDNEKYVTPAVSKLAEFFTKNLN